MAAANRVFYRLRAVHQLVQGLFTRVEAGKAARRRAFHAAHNNFEQAFVANDRCGFDVGFVVRHVFLERIDRVGVVEYGKFGRGLQRGYGPGAAAAADGDAVGRGCSLSIQMRSTVTLASSSSDVATSSATRSR